ncbi:MAG: sigma-70 family RNA polymerase sigma factor [Dysgonamonadaceae bacterium]|jgi:RNA polymerase sigma-70 factor (ECF subfamily)|nr:sigma-70 family RNA polymerase sigma factor [Dysgonamonadaceae bacterium]
MNLNLSDERTLIEGCKKGEPQARKQLYELYSGTMFALCLRYAPDKDSAEDILQEGFITVFTKIGDYSGKGSIEGWMRKIFITRALQEIRAKQIAKRYLEQAENEIIAEEVKLSVLDEISAKEIMDCIAELPAGYRTVFNLFAVEGYPHAEIARMLNIGESTSRSQYAHARKMLQEKLKNLNK